MKKNKDFKNEDYVYKAYEKKAIDNCCQYRKYYCA